MNTPTTPATARQPTPGRLPKLGRISATASVVEALEPRTIAKILKRHAVGDWGDLSDDDWQMNEDVMDDPNHDGRLFSAYADVPSKNGRLIPRVWVITDAPETEEAITTILLPEDY